MRTVLALLLPLLGAGCAATTPEGTLRSLYRDSRDGDDDLAALERRLDQVIALLDAGEERTPAEKLYAAGCLLDSTDPLEVARASELALAAAEEGDPRGLPLAAEAIDRERLLLGDKQRYGTQYFYTEATGRWSLYPWDTGTTDAERRAMGVPSLSEALDRLDELNEED